MAAQLARTHASRAAAKAAQTTTAAPAAASTLPTGGRARGLESWAEATLQRVLGLGAGGYAGPRCRCLAATANRGAHPELRAAHTAQHRSTASRCLVHWTLTFNGRFQHRDVRFQRSLSAVARGTALGPAVLTRTAAPAQCRLATKTRQLTPHRTRNAQPEQPSHTHPTKVFSCAALGLGEPPGMLGAARFTAAEPWVELRPPLPSHTQTAEPLQLREHRPLYPLTPADRLCTTGWCLTGRSGAFGGPEGAGEGGTACGGAKALVLPAGCCTRMLAEQSWGLAGWGSLPDWVLDHWARTRAGALGSGHCGRRHGWVSAARLHASPTTTHNDTKPPCEPWADGSRGQRR